MAAPALSSGPTLLWPSKSAFLSPTFEQDAVLLTLYVLLCPFFEFSPYPVRPRCASYVSFILPRRLNWSLSVAAIYLLKLQVNQVPVAIIVNEGSFSMICLRPLSGCKVYLNPQPTSSLPLPAPSHFFLSALFKSQL